MKVTKNLQIVAVYRFINRCRKEIRACELAQAYLAGIILCGAALEYILTAWIRAFDVPRPGRRSLTERRDLKHLIDRAYETRWFDFKPFVQPSG